MKIVITMAGKGSRFEKIGINKPKYKIIARGKTFFELSMLSLKDFFNEHFIFITREEIVDVDFISQTCNDLAIKNYDIITLDEFTDGQASTVNAIAKMFDDNDSIIVYNIDTYIKPGAINRNLINDSVDGFIPVIKASGDRWSFIKVNEEFKVIDIEEKKPISNLASVGFYYFKSWSDYKNVYESYRDEIKQNYKEVYIAPMYKYLLNGNGKNFITQILNSDDVFILGTPEEVIEFDPDFIKGNI
jgi:dTDP-glucose pyrophosphorylase